MTMLTPTRGPFEPARYPLESRSDVRAGSAAAHLATIKRILSRRSYDADGWKRCRRHHGAEDRDLSPALYIIDAGCVSGASLPRPGTVSPAEIARIWVATTGAAGFFSRIPMVTRPG